MEDRSRTPRITWSPRADRPWCPGATRPLAVDPAGGEPTGWTTFFKRSLVQRLKRRSDEVLEEVPAALPASGARGAEDSDSTVEGQRPTASEEG